MNEAAARIKINALLEAAGWRFFPDRGRPANVRLEPSVTLQPADLAGLGDDFDTAAKGFVDFLLLDAKGFPLIVLEAKAENKNPLTGKEQARKYARSLNCRFVLLSNGNLHYFWDLERGNPHLVTVFPTPDSVDACRAVTPDPRRLIDEPVGDDYIVRTQRPGYASEAAWKNAAERPDFIQTNGLRFLRPYQRHAVHAVQRAVAEGHDRFLFEMATGTGKTLTAAAVIKLFLRSGNARRVLFLVDRLELEEQAGKVFTALLSADFTTVVYKEKRDDWRRAEIVVTTVQSLLFDNKYRRLFSPTDFDLVISDEAHRSIGGNARAVFDYFVGSKLGLTATPRDYLKGSGPWPVPGGQEEPTAETGRGVRAGNPQRDAERRLLLDTYRTFGCESGQPTFRYSLLDGVRDGFLINPTVIDARTDVTTQLLSEEGFVVAFTDTAGEDQEETYRKRAFEKRFFSDATNRLFCRTFLAHALRDPVSGEVGKSIVFAVSQQHAATLTQIFNRMADRLFPGTYRSDFAVQVTSQVPDAQQFTVNFATNRLLGAGNVLPAYRTSKARVCVTVGMMTTGYDCTDILNLGLFRPIFSPTDFVQIKGRGTRRHDFRDQILDADLKASVAAPHKTAFKLFDFFGNCEYFETEFDYDEVLKLPRPRSGKRRDPAAEPVEYTGDYEHLGPDTLTLRKEQVIGAEGMKIDRMLFDRFADTVRADETVAAAVRAGQWDRVIDYVQREVFDKPEDYYTLAKLRGAVAVDRRVSLREILEKVFDLIPRFKSKDELLEEEFAKFIADHAPPHPKSVSALKTYFKAYVGNDRVRAIIDRRQFAQLATDPAFTTREYRAVPERYRALVPEYVKDYILPSSGL